MIAARAWRIARRTAAMTMIGLLTRCTLRATSTLAAQAGTSGSAFVPGRCFFPAAACQAGSHRPFCPRARGHFTAAVTSPRSGDSRAAPNSAGPDARVVRVVEDIKRPARDDRAYRMIWLRNGMQVLLASDPTTDMAAASMNIHAGHFQDPPEFPGMAHFHEHMLFLGTDKFPKEGEYEAFLNSHGGSSNAYTAQEDTNYYFSVKWDQLQGALERFSAFYQCPRFDPSAVEREMRAVDSEHINNRNDDGWRLYQLQKSLADPAHPFHKFGSGNYETLRSRLEEGIDTREALIRFHETYYSADIMKLAVIGREPLDVMQAWVLDLFSGVRTTQQPAHFDYGPPPFAASSLGVRVEVVPVKEMRRVTLAFPLPIDWRQQRRMQPYKPSRYISHLLGYEGPGSLYNALNGRGWIDSLSAGASGRMSDTEIFKVTLALTEEGMRHYEEAVALVFQYLKLLRESPIRRDIFEELRTMSEVKFAFREKEGAVDFASGASALMQDYEAESILWGPYQLELDEAGIRDYLSMLTPERLQMTVVSKHLQDKAASAPEAWRTEKWYGTLHRVAPLEAKLLTSWANPPSVDPSLRLPSANPFMPTDFSIKADLPAYKSLPADNPEAPLPPSLISETPGVSLYHKLDRRFRVPKALFFAHLRSRHVYGSPWSVVMHRLYSMLLREELNDFAYDAALAGLSYSINARTTGLSLKVAGYSHKLPVLLDRVLERSQSLLKDCQAKGDDDPEVRRKFEKLRDSLDREYSNFLARETPYELAIYNTRQALDAHCWHVGQYLAVLRAEGCSPSAMAATVADQMGRMDLDAFAHGNLDEADARALTMELTDALKLKPLYEGEAPEERTVDLPQGTEVVFQADGPNPEEDNSAVEIHFQVGAMGVGGSLEEDMLVDVIGHLASTSAYHTLRTEKQLGYIVSAFTRRLNGVQGFSVLVQSPSASPTALDGHVEAWMTSFREELAKMSDGEFAGHILAVEALKMEKDKRLSEEAHRHWGEIVERRFEFDRMHREKAALHSLTKDKLLSLWDSRVAAGSAGRRKLCSYVFAEQHAGDKLPASPIGDFGDSATPGAQAKRLVIDSLEALRTFKKQRPLYPAAGR